MILFAFVKNVIQISCNTVINGKGLNIETLANSEKIIYDVASFCAYIIYYPLISPLLNF